MQVNPQQLKGFLLDAGLVAEDVIDEAQSEAEKTGQKLGDVLLAKKALPEEQLRKMYAYILGIPYVNLEKEQISKEILQLIPEAIAQKHNIIAFQKNDRELRVAMLNPDDIQTIDFIKKKTGLRISPCFTSQSSIDAALKQYKKSLQAEFGDIINKNAQAVAAQEDLEKIAQDLPVIKIVDTTTFP